MANTPTILLAEDSENDITLLLRAFERAHLANPVQVVRDGQEAIAYLNGEGHYSDRERYPLPYILLLDLDMPRKNGFQVLEWVRARPSFIGLEIVILTSSQDSRDLVKTFERGAASYLVKSPGFEDLMDMVKRLGCYLVLTNQKPEHDAREALATL